MSTAEPEAPRQNNWYIASVIAVVGLLLGGLSVIVELKTENLELRIDNTALRLEAQVAKATLEQKVETVALRTELAELRRATNKP